MRLSLSFFACLLSQPLAAAAPWIQDQDYLYARASVASEHVEGLEAIRSDMFLDYGINDRWGATFKLERVDYADNNDFNSSGWRATVRRKLLNVGSFGSAVEFGAIEGRAIGGLNGCDQFGVEVRTGAGWSGTWRDQNTFASIEVAGRFHDACQRNRVEFIYGVETFDRLWTINLVWVERGNDGADSVKLQSEWLWRTDRADFSVGYRQEQGQVFDENSLFLAIAYRY